MIQWNDIDNKRDYISNYITSKDIEKWNDGQIVTIHAQPNRGKSHWVKMIFMIKLSQKGKRYSF